MRSDGFSNYFLPLAIESAWNYLGSIQLPGTVSTCRGFLQQLTLELASKSFSWRRFFDVVLGGVMGKLYGTNVVEVLGPFLIGVEEAEGC